MARILRGTSCASINSCTRGRWVWIKTRVRISQVAIQYLDDFCCDVHHMPVHTLYPRVPQHTQPPSIPQCMLPHAPCQCPTRIPLPQMLTPLCPTPEPLYTQIPPQHTPMPPFKMLVTPVETSALKDVQNSHITNKAFEPHCVVARAYMFH
jgi:hypothetical protein